MSTVAEYLVDELIKYGVTDAFGIPGGVILRFLYALDKRDGIEPHLAYHEQTAAFAACGYAQASGNLGVTYATRGPGICNAFTAIAEAYQESIPVLFVTAHGTRREIEGVRFSANQEMDIVDAVKKITKYAANIECIEETVPIIKKAIKTALSGRRGPVLIDVSAGLWSEEVSDVDDVAEEEKTHTVDCDRIVEEINAAKRPVILIGDGLRYGVQKETLLRDAENIKLPIISSRGSLDLVSGSSYYFGYVGSHGIRYSNFILSKADLIVVLGNRMAFPFTSASFKPILEKRIIRIEIDEGELRRNITGEVACCANACDVLGNLGRIAEHREWIYTCKKLKTELLDEDCSDPVEKIVGFINSNQSAVYVCDVGNNEFWFSRAYERSGCADKVLMSKSFGTLGSAIGKSIGAYYGSKSNVVCVVGDQGLQYNLQELQYIIQHKLPIQILLINNGCSRMIADHESGQYEELLHVNRDTGYDIPDFRAIAKAYGLEENIKEIRIDENITLTPSLPKGRECQDMEPSLDRDRYEALNSL